MIRIISYLPPQFRYNAEEQPVTNTQNEKVATKPNRNEFDSNWRQN